MLEVDDILIAVRQLHDRIREQVVQATASRSAEDLSQVVAEQGGDVVFALDQSVEQMLLEFVDRELARHEPIVLVAEGIPDGQVVLPEGTEEKDCRWRLIIDPIDGTRLLMYQKRSGWALTALAPNKGPQTKVSDVCLAVQTEIPTLKQHLCDQVWAVRGRGAEAIRCNRLTNESEPLTLQPSRATTVYFGYSSITRFFPGARDVLGAIDDEVIRGALGPQPPGGTLCFEDQYPSTGGQLYSLLSGSDRFLADLRPLMAGIVAERNETLGHCCHPYDICTALIAEESGVQITSPGGEPLDVPLDVETDVAWVGYANEAIRQQVEPELRRALEKRNLIGNGE